METFLNLVAKDLYLKCGGGQTGLADVTVVFPNRRARLFFDDCIAACSDQPVWSPQYTTIEELFHSQSDLKPADRIEMVTLLHAIYADELHSDESLDSFWSWGELMLADFDDVDRNLAPADQLFSLLREQRELSDTSFLTDKQKEALEQFFGEMKNSKPTRLHDRHVAIWSVLGNIYNRFTKLLADKGIGYNGMIQRRVIESLDTERLTARKYVFVGFNSLDKAEKELFRAIQRTGKAMFYWDYNPAYTEGLQHEAGRFLKDNLREFPNELPHQAFENLPKTKLSIVETSTDNAQARFIPQWLDSLQLEGKAGRETAIVLADESLLQPVLHSIPQEKIANVNITMGYSLTETSLFSLVSALIDMQRLAACNKGRYSIQTLSRVLGNPMTAALCTDAPVLLEQLRRSRRMFPDTQALKDNPQLSVLFTPATDNLQLLQYLLTVLKALVPVIRERDDDTLFQPLNQESLYRIYTQINRLHSLMEQGGLQLQTETLCRLIRSILSSTTVPFHGEPAVGMQVMGLIETRNLDFKNVLLLSAQEGTLPRGGQNASFIPYNIRLAFGLTTMHDKSAVSSYNFHHLIQRAENVTMVYNGNAEAKGIGKGQMSRYLLQLIVSGRDVQRIVLKTDKTDTRSLEPLTIQKTPDVMERLRQRGLRGLAPSALNEFINCKLRYYYDQIAELRKPDETDTDIDNALFGTLFHKSAEIAYNELAGKDNGNITKEMLTQLISDDKHLEEIIKQAFDKEYFKKGSTDTKDYSGIQSINYDVIKMYLIQILQMDADLYAPFTYIGSEKKDFRYPMTVSTPDGQEFEVILKGAIDRMDQKDGITRIVDYKTGSKHDYPASVDAMFPIPGKTRNEQAFQIMFYAYVVSKCLERDGHSIKLAPVLIYSRASSKPTKEDLYYKVGKDFIYDFAGQISQNYESRLKDLISLLYNPEDPFSPTDDIEKTCRNCDFNQLCGRNK